MFALTPDNDRAEHWKSEKYKYLSTLPGVSVGLMQLVFPYISCIQDLERFRDPVSQANAIQECQLANNRPNALQCQSGTNDAWGKAQSAKDSYQRVVP